MYIDTIVKRATMDLVIDHEQECFFEALELAIEKGFGCKEAFNEYEWKLVDYKTEPCLILTFEGKGYL